jgi:AcrR family transcriptional regulator
VPRRVETRTVSSPRSAVGGRRHERDWRAEMRGQRRVEWQRSHAGSPGVQVAEIQRSRLLSGAAGAIEEHGYAHTTVAQITGRARVSRRTFYELFANREACLVALIESVVGLVEDESAGDPVVLRP